jgi:hypothetical protein
VCVRARDWCVHTRDYTPDQAASLPAVPAAATPCSPARRLREPLPCLREAAGTVRVQAACAAAAQTGPTMPHATAVLSPVISHSVTSPSHLTQPTFNADKALLAAMVATVLTLVVTLDVGRGVCATSACAVLSTNSNESMSSSATSNETVCDVTGYNHSAPHHKTTQARDNINTTRARTRCEGQRRQRLCRQHVARRQCRSCG